MNKSQRVILGVGLIVLAVLLHLSLCKWDTYWLGSAPNIKVFGWLYVRESISFVAGVLLGIVAPIISLIAGAFIVAS